MTYRNPLSISAHELKDLKENIVSIRYNNFELEGYIEYIILSAQDPTKFETFEFILTPNCKAKLKKDINLIPKYFTISDIQGIAKLSQKRTNMFLLKQMLLNF